MATTFRLEDRNLTKVEDTDTSPSSVRKMFVEVEVSTRTEPWRWKVSYSEYSGFGSELNFKYNATIHNNNKLVAIVFNNKKYTDKHQVFLTIGPTLVRCNSDAERNLLVKSVKNLNDYEQKKIDDIANQSLHDSPSAENPVKPVQTQWEKFVSAIKGRR